MNTIKLALFLEIFAKWFYISETFCVLVIIKRLAWLNLDKTLEV